MSKSPRVHVVCQNARQDRVIPRMARYLRERLGWTVSGALETCDVLYLLAYFEAQRVRPLPVGPAVVAYLTHREEVGDTSKARLFDAVAESVDLRVVTCRMYGDMVAHHGPTMQAPAPIERERFVIAKARRRPSRPTVGFAGYTYSNHRKGEDIAALLVSSPIGERCDWRASGRGWPVPTRKYAWDDMPAYYQSLDVLVMTGRVEGVPMPTLEALACGVSVVVPAGVGIHDELPEMAGIYRYERDNLDSLTDALERAAYPEVRPDPEALRAATAGYSVEAWCRAHADAFADLATSKARGSGRAKRATAGGGLAAVAVSEPTERGTGSRRGIYCVAFGGPARACAARMMESAKRHMPDIPICLCAAEPIGPEDVLVTQPDSDVGGRRAKLLAYELAPAEWQAVLYLDADTEVVAPIYPYWKWIEDGWEFVISKDPHLMDTLDHFARQNNQAEMAELKRSLRTTKGLQLNGGVWAFGRSARIAAFFGRWRAEWERYAQRDQGALIRALYADPLRVWVVGNEWNTFPKYSQGVTTAGLMHYPGDARRWSGLLPGRIDSPEAWAAVRRYEGNAARRRGR